MDYKVSSLSRDEICDMTKRFREVLGYTNRVRLPIMKVLEILDRVIPGFEWQIVPCGEMPDKHAEMRPEEIKIYIREDVYDGAYAGNGRDRMTIAHEIAHLLLHIDQKPSYARAFKDNELPAYCSSEWQAKAFAAELLIPRALCMNMTVDEIARKCGVSGDSARYQHGKVLHKSKGGMPYGH